MGDRSPRARADALKRYAHYSADNVPDIIEHEQAAKNGNAVLYESLDFSKFTQLFQVMGGKGEGSSSERPA